MHAYQLFQIYSAGTEAHGLDLIFAAVEQLQLVVQTFQDADGGDKSQEAAEAALSRNDRMVLLSVARSMLRLFRDSFDGMAASNVDVDGLEDDGSDTVPSGESQVM